MKLKKLAIVRKTQTTTSYSEYLDVHHGISNNTWIKEITYHVFGIPVFKENRHLDVKEVILAKDGEPVGYHKPK